MKEHRDREGGSESKNTQNDHPTASHPSSFEALASPEGKASSRLVVSSGCLLGPVIHRCLVGGVRIPVGVGIAAVRVGIATVPHRVVVMVRVLRVRILTIGLLSLSASAPRGSA